MKTKKKQNDLKLRALISAWACERDKELLARKNKWDLEIEICNYLKEKIKPTGGHQFGDLLIYTGYKSVWDQEHLINLNREFEGNSGNPVSKTYSVNRAIFKKIKKENPELYERMNGMRFLSRMKPRIFLSSDRYEKIKFPISKLEIYDRKKDIPNLKEDDIDPPFHSADDFDI